MTGKYDAFFKKYDDEKDVDQSTLPDYSVKTPDVPETSQSFIQAGLKGVERTGGALLASTVKGISTIGQTVMGALQFMEESGGALTHGENDKYTGFTWDNFKEDVGQMGAVFGGAAKAGVGQAKTVLASRNLTEFGQNVVTGTDILKALPGTSFFRDADSRAEKFGVGVAGFALEVLLDPTSYIGGAAYKGAAALTAKGVKSGALGERAADVIGRAAANTATFNWTGGAIAMTARESSFAARESLVGLVNKFATTSPRTSRVAATILEWGMGPTALSSNSAMTTALSKYAALKEDLPKDMLKVSNTTATMIAHLPQKQQAQAQKLFGELAGASTKEMEEAAIAGLSRLGLNKKEALSVGMQYRAANLRLMDVLKEASDSIPALKELSAGMSEYHIRRSYRMFVDPKVRTDWLDHLVKVNSAGSYQFARTNLGSQLDEALGVRKVAGLESFDMNFAPSNVRVEPGNINVPPELYGSQVGKAAFEKNYSPERMRALESQLSTVERNIGNAKPTDNLDGLVAERDTLRGTLKAMQSVKANKNNSLVESLSQKVAALDTQIDDASISDGMLKKLTERRNVLQGRLEKELGKADLKPVNTGNPATRAMKTSEPTVGWVAKQNEELARLEERLQGTVDPVAKTKLRNVIEQKREKITRSIGLKNDVRQNISGDDLDTMDFGREVARRQGSDAEVRSMDEIGYQWNNKLDEPKPYGFDVPDTATDLSALGAAKTARGTEDAFPSMRDELLSGPDRSTIPTIRYTMTPDLRQEFQESLFKYLDENDVVARTGFVGYKQGDDGTFLADFAERKAIAKNATLKDIQEWTADWGAAKGLTDDEVSKLNAAVSNSVLYVPGSAEFSTMVREKSKALLDLDPKMAQILDAELAISKVDTKALGERTLDPIWHDLFGEIDNFSVNAAQQGVKVGDVAARAKLLSELKNRGLVRTEQWLADNPDVARNGGWVPMDNGFAMAGAGDGSQYMIQASNKRSIDAIDRSLGDMNKMQVLTQASNLFRRSALGTDPSAHVTQFLGNLSMLQMMGLRGMFGDNPHMARGMTRAFKAVMLSDDLFKDAVDNGVMVSQTVLNSQQAQAVSRNMLALPSMAGDNQAVLTTLFRAADDIFKAGSTATVDKGARVFTNKVVAGGLRKAGMEGTDAISAATHLASPSAMFQLPDQMTRLYSYQTSLIKKTKDMLKANPTLANFTKESGADINWKAALEHAQKIKNSNFTPETVADLQAAHKLLKEEAAALANDVALNYSDVPLTINYLSKTGVVPFIKFQWKATGRIMEFMDEKPWAFTPYYAAQRNLNDSMNPSPDAFEQQREALSPTVRDALVLPTGGKDSMGRQEFLDLSRWLPFGMYASAANGGGQEAGLSMQPNSIISTPVLDVIHSFMDIEGQKQPGQSASAFLAQKLTETFAPAGVAPGGRKVEQLAKAIEQSMQYVDADGVAHDREPTGFEKAVMGYAAIPENVGQSVTEIGNRMQGEETLTSAKGVPKQQTADRPRTTVEQAKGRYIMPGIGFSSDPEKTVDEYDRRYDLAIDNLKRQMGSQVNNMGTYPSGADLDRMEKIKARIAELEQLKVTKGRMLLLGE